MLRLIKISQRGYVSIIKKYPNGLGNRMERFDEWAKTWNNPQITSYYDYFYNGETKEFGVVIPDSENARNELAQCATRYRPAIYEFHEKMKIFEPHYADDKLLSIDVN